MCLAIPPGPSSLRSSLRPNKLKSCCLEIVSLKRKQHTSCQPTSCNEFEAWGVRSCCMCHDSFGTSFVASLLIASLDAMMGMHRGLYWSRPGANCCLLTCQRAPVPTWSCRLASGSGKMQRLGLCLSALNYKLGPLQAQKPSQWPTEANAPEPWRREVPSEKASRRCKEEQLSSLPVGKGNKLLSCCQTVSKELEPPSCKPKAGFSMHRSFNRCLSH